MATSHQYGDLAFKGMCVPLVIFNLSFTTPNLMFRNYLLTALRKFRREPVYAFIHITGLVLGISCSILTFLWVHDELSYNRYHKNNNRVFRVMENQFSSDGVITTGIWSPGILAETLKSQFAEVEASRPHGQLRRQAVQSRRARIL